MADDVPQMTVEKADDRLKTYEEFWPFYLREHSKESTRHLHYVGSSLALLVVGTAAVTRRPGLLLAVPFAGYGPAWIAHFAIEKNKPATFKFPFWSFISDFRMFFLWVSGRLDEELKQHGAKAA